MKNISEQTTCWILRQICYNSHIRFHTCYPRTGIWGHSGHKFTEKDQAMFFQSSIQFQRAHLALTTMPRSLRSHFPRFWCFTLTLTEALESVSVWFYTLHCCHMVDCLDNCMNKQVYRVYTSHIFNYSCHCEGKSLWTLYIKSYSSES